jgi:hypothetical protein
MYLTAWKQSDIVRYIELVTIRLISINLWNDRDEHEHGAVNCVAYNKRIVSKKRYRNWHDSSVDSVSIQYEAVIYID